MTEDEMEEIKETKSTQKGLVQELSELTFYSNEGIPADYGALSEAERDVYRSDVTNFISNLDKLGFRITDEKKMTFAEDDLEVRRITTGLKNFIAKLRHPKEIRKVKLFFPYEELAMKIVRNKLDCVKSVPKPEKKPSIATWLNKKEDEETK